jgi:hypothetical protein
MSSGSLAGGIGVWGDQPSPGGLRLASRYHGCAGVVGFAPFSSGLAGWFGVWGPAFARWASAGKPVSWLRRSCGLCSFLFGVGGRVWRLGTPGLRPAGVPGGLRCCVGISAPRSLGLAAGLASGDTRPSARGCPRWVASLRGGFLLLALWGGGGVGVWGTPGLRPAGVPSGLRCCVGISAPRSLGLAGWFGVWGTPGLRPAGVPGGLRCCVGDFLPSFLPSFLLSFETGEL